MNEISFNFYILYLVCIVNSFYRRYFFLSSPWLLLSPGEDMVDTVVDMEVEDMVVTVDGEDMDGDVRKERLMPSPNPMLIQNRMH